MGGLWIALMLLYLVRYVDRLDLKKSAALGAILGLSILTTSGTMIFLPVVMALVILWAPAPGPAIKNSAVIALTAALLVSPWTLRNYSVFNEFVPVRTGLGQIATLGRSHSSRRSPPRPLVRLYPPRGRLPARSRRSQG